MLCRISYIFSSRMNVCLRAFVLIDLGLRKHVGTARLDSARQQHSSLLTQLRANRIEALNIGGARHVG